MNFGARLSIFSKSVFSRTLSLPKMLKNIRIINTLQDTLVDNLEIVGLEAYKDRSLCPYIYHIYWRTRCLKYHFSSIQQKKHQWLLKLVFKLSIFLREKNQSFFTCHSSEALTTLMLCATILTLYFLQSLKVSHSSASCPLSPFFPAVALSSLPLPHFPWLLYPLSLAKGPLSVHPTFCPLL